MGYTVSESVSASQYIALGTTFTDVSGANIAIKDLVKAETPVGAASTGDQIWVWDTTSATWTKYFYRVSARSGATKTWCKLGETAETTDTIAPGTTFFFLRDSNGAATTLTLAGAVKPLDATSTFTVAASQLAFASNPFPVSMLVTDLSSKYTTGSPVGAASTGDQVWLWDTANSTWDKYFYRVSARSGATKTWCKVGETVETSDSIPAGKGFFFQRDSNGDTATITLGM